MLINIESGKGPLKVAVSQDDGDVIEFTAPTLKDAHKMLKDARKNGWDTLRPKKKS